MNKNQTNAKTSHYSSKTSHYTTCSGNPEKKLFGIIFLLVFLTAFNNLLAADKILENETISNGTTITHQADGNLTAQNNFVIQSGSDVLLQSKQKIYLKPGFRANQGSNFKGNITSNLSPVAQSQIVLMRKDTKKNIVLAASDFENNDLTFSMITNPNHGSISGSFPNLQYESAYGFVGNDTFQYVVNDGNSDSLPANISISVEENFVQAEILSQFPSTSHYSSAIFNIGGNDIVEYKYRIDSQSSFSSAFGVEHPVELFNLNEGRHLLEVIGKDSTGLWQSESAPTVWSWNIIGPVENPISPDISIVTPKGNYIINKSNIKIFGTTRETGSVTINGEPAIVGNKTFILDDYPVKEGTNIISIQTAGECNDIPVIVADIPEGKLLIDDFTDNDLTRNLIGGWTSDDQTLVENINFDDNGNTVKKLTWNGNASTWYTSLWDSQTIIEGTDASPYELLTFKIKGQNGGENFSIEIEDLPKGPNYNSSVILNNFQTVTTSWQEVTIPLRKFSNDGIWKTQLRSIVFNFDQNESGTIFIDDISLKTGRIDDFADDSVDINNLDLNVNDSGTLVLNAQEYGYRKISWNDTNAFLKFQLEDNSFYYNANYFDYLVLKVKGKTGNENLSIQLEDNQNAASVEVSSYKSISTNWQTIYIPLNDFNVNLSSIKSLKLLFNKIGSGTIYLDKIGFSNTSDAVVKGMSLGPVSIKDNQLIVNNAPFQIKGVSYQPTPIGEEPQSSSALFTNSSLWDRDLPNLREMECNTIRIWKNMNSIPFLNVCYNYGSESIYVIMGFDIDPELDLSNVTIRNNIKSAFTQYVTNYKDHPAVLMWALGNELNLMYSGNLADWYSLANELGEIAYQIEGLNYHPVLIVNADVKNLSDKSLGSDDDSLSFIDVWGLNCYRGFSFKGFFESYRQLSSKPLILTEYGIDAWHTNNQLVPSEGYEDQNVQNDYIVNNWKEISREVHVLGGTVMEYCDEWHKNIAHNYNTQDYGGFPLRYDQPDNYVNEEWWGLFSIESDGTNLNILKPRKVVTGLKFEFNNINQNNDLISPEDVTNLNAIPGDRQVGLTWINSINSKNDLKDQLLYINNDSGFGEPISLGKVTNSRLITSLQNNLNYSFKITTIDISGNESAGKSISCTPVDNNPPEDVENFTVIAQDESVALSWAPSPNSNGDLVNQLLYIDNGAGYGLAISLGASTLNYTVNSLTNNTLYHFKITCIDNANNESEGALVLATPQSSLAPLVIITSPASSLVSNSNVITIQGTVSNNQAIIKVNGTFVANTGGSFMAENILLPNEGENTISVTAEYGGNVGQNQIFVIRDTTSPTIKITSPKNGETITGHI